MAIVYFLGSLLTTVVILCCVTYVFFTYSRNAALKARKVNVGTVAPPVEPLVEPMAAATADARRYALDCVTKYKTVDNCERISFFGENFGGLHKPVRTTD